MIEKELVAPCGMNCAICSSYLAFKNDLKNKGVQMPYCIGCRPRDKKCAFLKKRCSLLMNKKIEFCYECDEFPCNNLKKIDKRYRSNYHMSMIENLENLKESGISKFLEKEQKKWKCSKCGKLICCHNGICFNCQLPKLKQKTKKYRWTDD